MGILSFQPETVEAEDCSPAPERVVSGAPRGQVRNGYTSSDGNRLVGEWNCSAGEWRVSYSEWEYCHIIEGQVRLTGDDGGVVEAGPGGNLVIEPGFKGVWENLTSVRKLYVIDLAVEAGAA